MNDTPDYTDEEKALLSKPLLRAATLLRAAKEIRDIELLRAALAESDGALFKATGEIIAVTNERDVWARRAETAESDNSRLRGKVEEAVKVLSRIERWFGEFPQVTETAPDGTIKPSTYGWLYGSNGERDYMRGLARAFLGSLNPEKETTDV